MHLFYKQSAMRIPLIAIVLLHCACAITAQHDSFSQEIFITYEEMPQFPGGEAARKKFIASHFHLCEICEEVTGKIILRFDIDATGYPAHLEIIRPLHPHFLPVIEAIWAAMPCFIPGKWKGQPVSTSVIFPIKIGLE
ncbi:MAG: hypothetical protein HUU01_20265 [Saprospiraceae bacterium]|nr:hypothetical protein [Saprospiraceae bacterium]